jgi:hypothetical protein
LSGWELREAMRSLMGLGKRKRLRVDQPTITGLAAAADSVLELLEVLADGV